MLHKWVHETVQKVITKADEVRNVVTDTASKALGLPYTGKSADKLQVHLEAQAKQTHTLQSLGEMYRKWINLCEHSSRIDTPRYFPHGNVSLSSTSSFEDVTPRNTHTQMNVDAHNNATTDVKIDKASSETTMDDDKLKKQNDSKIMAGSPPPVSPRDVADNVPATSSNNDDNNNNTNNNDKHLHQQSQVPRTPTHVHTHTNASATPTYSHTHPHPHTNHVGIFSDMHLADRGMTFRQVLLKSKAIEFSLHTLSGQDDIREYLTGPCDDNEISARSLLLKLLNITLRGGEKIHRELVCMLMTSDLQNEAHMGLLITCVSLLKYDWEEDELFDQRKYFAFEIENLKNILNSSDSPPLDPFVSGFDPANVATLERSHTQNVRTCKKLLSLYDVLDKNFIVTSTHKTSLHKTTEETLDDMVRTLTHKQSEYNESTTKSINRMAVLEDDLSKQGNDIAKDLTTLNEKKKEIDSAMNGLESKRQELVKTLNELDEQITSLVEKKKNNTQMCDEMTKKLDLVQEKIKGKLATEGHLQAHNNQQIQDATNITSVLNVTREKLLKTLLEQAADVKTKSAKITKSLNGEIIKYILTIKNKLVFEDQAAEYYIMCIERLDESKEAEKSDNTLKSEKVIDTEKNDETETNENGQQKLDRNYEELIAFRHKLAKQFYGLEELWGEIKRLCGQIDGMFLRHLTDNEMVSSETEKETDEADTQEGPKSNDSAAQVTRKVSDLHVSEVVPQDVRDSLDDLKSYFKQLRSKIAPHLQTPHT